MAAEPREPSATSTHDEHDKDLQLRTAHKTIARLREDIRRLSDELNKKSTTLSGYMDVAHEQSLRITSLTATLQDTVHWDPATCPLPSSCSTPTPQLPWSEVNCGSKKAPGSSTTRPPSLRLSNRFEVLSHPAVHAVSGPGRSLEPGSAEAILPLASAVSTASSTSGLDSEPGGAAAVPSSAGPCSDGNQHHPAASPDPCLSGLKSNTAAPTVLTSGAPAAIHPASPAPSSSTPGGDAQSHLVAGPDHPHPSRSSSASRHQEKPKHHTLVSSSRRRLLKEAVRRHSASFPHREPVEIPPNSNNLPPGLPSTSSAPRPLFPPTTAIIGDSVIRHVRFFNAITHCFPGSTVPTLLQKIPELLDSLPSTVNKLIIHIGFNDTSLCQSEVTKKHFQQLFNLLSGSGKSVMFSGPLPSFARDGWRFSRLLYLSTWLQAACSLSRLNYIDNFNLFWNRSEFYRADGIHPSRLGSRVLAHNIQHAVQTSTT